MRINNPIWRVNEEVVTIRSHATGAAKARERIETHEGQHRAHQSRTAAVVRPCLARSLGNLVPGRASRWTLPVVAAKEAALTTAVLLF